MGATRVDADGGSGRARAAAPVVVGVDGSVGSRVALRFAAKEAELRDTRLVVLMVQAGEAAYTPPGSAPGEGMSSLADLMTGAATRVAVKASPHIRLPHVTPRLRALVAKELGEQSERPVDLELWEGSTWRVLAERSGSAAMVVIGARGGGGFPGLRLGSVAQRVLSHSRCPVVVVRRWPIPESAGAAAPVVVGLDPWWDFSPAGAEMLAFAWEEARLRGVPLRALVAQPDTARSAGSPDEPTRIKELAVLAGLPLGEVEPVVAAGHAAHALFEASQEAALVVVGPGRSTAGGLQPGSVGRQLVDRAGCPVVVFEGGAQRVKAAA
ncbi:MAG TPA: universal stress protein [Acidimicrobiales bacterium]|nr:universal stress protein [Acidimicrobiales bacterium]